MNLLSLLDGYWNDYDIDEMFFIGYKIRNYYIETKWIIVWH